MCKRSERDKEGERVSVPLQLPCRPTESCKRQWLDTFGETRIASDLPSRSFGTSFALGRETDKPVCVVCSREGEIFHFYLCSLGPLEFYIEISVNDNAVGMRDAPIQSRGTAAAN